MKIIKSATTLNFGLPFRSGQALTSGYATFLSVIRLAYASLMPVPNVSARLRVEERRQS
jgi:hypothetical protein